MEIVIDFATTRRIAAQEYATASAEIAKLGVIEAYRRSQIRHDERLASAADSATLACKAGCSWCCHFTIDVRAVEAFRILEFVAAEFTPLQKAQVRSEIEANCVELEPLNDEERMQRNLKCPFLQEGHCSIYTARPQTCRNYHATSVEGCRRSFEEPDNLDIDPEFAPFVYQIGGAHVDAFSKAAHDAGYDMQAFELNAALSAALAQPDARERFEARQAPFAALCGDDVPLEFIEED